MTAVRPETGTDVAEGKVTTPRVAEARASITREPVVQRDGRWKRFVDAVRGDAGERAPARPPHPGTNMLRVGMSVLMSILCVLTVGGAVLLLLLWQQSRDNGVLTTQIDRTWDLLDTLRVVERWVAFGVVPVAVAWIALATVNAGRATGRRRNAIVAAISLPIGLAAIWFVGRELVAGTEDPVNQAFGWVLQVTMLAIPMLFLERVATASEARHRPLRAGFIVAAAYLAQLQFLGGLSTVGRTDVADDWGRYGAYLLIGALIQVVGTLALNEAARAIEDGAHHRYELRSRFSESLLAQASTT